jgi:NitT/TauT family transport system permease protein
LEGDNGELMDYLIKLNKKLLSYYLIVVFFILWQVGPSLGWVDSQFIPSLSQVLDAAWTSIQKGELLIGICISLQRTFIGFILAIVIGVPLGFILGGWLPRVSKFLSPLFSGLSQINALTLFPIFLVLFGIGEGVKVSIIFWAAFWPLMFTTISGIQQMDSLLIKAARSMNADGVTIFFKVILPGVSRNIFTGIKTGATMAFMMLIGAEVMGADSGLGWIVHNSQVNNTIPRLYSALITIAILGLLINYFIEWLERNIITWKEEVPE